MKLYMTQRHYVYSENTLKIIEDSAAKFEEHLSDINSNKENLDISIYLSANIKTLSEDIIARIINVVDKFNSMGIKIVFYPKASTSGKVFVSELFGKNFAHFGDIYGLSDLDQFPIYTSEQIKNAVSLAKKMIEEDSLYFNGARDVPVILGVNKEASDIRSINELIFSLSSGKRFLIGKGPSWSSKLSDSYLRIGDITSGFYMINPFHKDYDRFKKEVNKYSPIYSIQTFSIEYFASIWSAINSNISLGYVYSYANPYYISPGPEEEIVKALDSIGLMSQQLASTSIAENLRKTLADKNLILKELGDFFKEKDILSVIDAMKEGLA